MPHIDTHYSSTQAPNPGRSAKAAEQLWKELFADNSIERDQVDAVNDDGKPIGKAGQGQVSCILACIPNKYQFNTSNEYGVHAINH